MSHQSKKRAKGVTALLVDEERLVLEEFSHVPIDPQKGLGKKGKGGGSVRGAEEGKKAGRDQPPNLHLNR